MNIIIKTLTLNLAEGLASTLDTPEKVEIYAYSLYMIGLSLLSTVFLIFVALYLDILPALLAFLIVFIPFRTFGGGVHLETLPRCLIIGTLLIIGSAYWADKVYLQPFHFYVLFMIALVFAICSTMEWVPASKNPIRDLNLIYMQKRNMLLSIIIWAGLVCLFTYFSHNNLALAMIAGALVSSVLISPLGFYLMGVIDKVCNKCRRGVINL